MLLTFWRFIFRFFEISLSLKVNRNSNFILISIPDLKKMKETLKSLNTFAIDVISHRVVTAHTENELLTHWQDAMKKNLPVLLLGEGSNVLFLEDFLGTVLLNRIKGITITEDENAWHLHVGAGEKWHDLVNYSLDLNMPGLENLALIPGCVGSAPVQNIGAYGVELKDVCEYVDILLLDNGKKRRLSAVECQFAHRQSVFMHSYRDNCAIVAVGLKLKKAWKPVLRYADLSKLNANNITPREIFDIVCAIRRRKLPDPEQIGNAGSFFKGPVINAKDAAQLLKCYPDAPHYPQPNGDVKIAAGWLIERCQLKGLKLGGAAVYEKHALVLINDTGHATGDDIAALATYIRQQVAHKFAIWLEPEVRFIAADGEVDAISFLSRDILTQPLLSVRRNKKPVNASFMEKFRIQGPTQLIGEIEISGSKHCALPILYAALLTKEPVEIQNVPKISDIDATMNLLGTLGAEVKRNGSIVHIDAGGVNVFRVSDDISKTMRASIWALAPLVARFGEAEIALPGGCAIGARPVDLHISGLEQLGVAIRLEDG